MHAPLCQTDRERPLLIAGPCVIEGSDALLRVAEGLQEAAENTGFDLVFKSSFDKANRTSVDSYRGPGLEEGLRALERVRGATQLPITTDVHLPSQVAAAAEVVDLLQIPAFLCRQTDLLVAARDAGRPINIKKGQFLAAADMAHAVEKAGGPDRVMVTERGTMFGYGDLVVDMRSLVRMRDLGVAICFDATHSVQRPGSRGSSSGGERQFIPALARAALSVGVDAIFAEVHHQPDQALSDAATQLPLADMRRLLRSWRRAWEIGRDPW